MTKLFLLLIGGFLGFINGFIIASIIIIGKERDKK